MRDSKNLFCSSKFPWAGKKGFFEIYGKFGHAPPKMFASPGVAVDKSQDTQKP
jgi:hypothetical protein